MTKDKKQDETLKNVFISSSSIARALLMCLIGATDNSETPEKLKHLLNLDQYDSTEILLQVKQTISHFDSLLNEDLILSEANKMFFDKDIEFKSEFFNEIAQYFNADIESLNFNDAKYAAQVINKWCEEKTFGKIKKILTENDLYGAVLVLINAIYFKAKWLYEFEPYNTSQNVMFTMENGQKTPVEMMSMIKYLSICEEVSGLDASMCQLPYKGETMFMTIVLPKRKETKLREIESKLNCQILKNAFKGKPKQSVDIQLPKFKIEYESEVSFKCN